jgi:YHS domain-containing protein
MALIVRQKGEMTPLPDGVVARMQFSPYRVQLAGIHTSPVEFRPLIREIVLAGLLESASTNAADLARPTLAAEVFENDVGLFRVGQPVEATSEAFPDQVFPACVTALAPQVSATARSVGVQVEIDNARLELRPGMFVTARVRVPLAQLPSSERLVLEAWRNRTAVHLCAASLASPLGAAPGSGLAVLLESAVQRAALHQGLLLAIPESAVIDTGTRKIVFLEQAPGLFDAVEVWVGRRCGECYPVLGGLKPGQSVVTAGSFLLDAETRLNPAAAASYFGAASRGSGLSATPLAPAAPSGLSPEDQQLVKRQKVCPVTDQPLGSMGTPFRVIVAGRTIFVCCQSCAPALRKNPAKYLTKLPK